MISPEEALAQRRQNESDLIASCENEIDQALTKQFTGANAISVDVSAFPLNEYVVRELKQLYEKAGWQVNYRWDKTDIANYFTLSLAPSGKFPQLLRGSFLENEV